METVFLEKREVAEGVKRFVFKPVEKFGFEAGQFAFFNFEVAGKKFSKHFTISNSPTRENIEMTTLMSGSDYKNALDSIEEGHKVDVPNAMGEFTLAKSKGKPAVFLAGGIGITPVRSMLQWIADKGEEKEAMLFYGNRTKERIVFRQELEALQEKIKGLKIVHVLSDLSGEQEKKWSGETGFISREIIERNLKEIEDREEAVFYIVGPPKFVEAMKGVAGGIGIGSERVVAENFSGY